MQSPALMYIYMTPYARVYVFAYTYRVTSCCVVWGWVELLGWVALFVCAHVRARLLFTVGCCLSFHMTLAIAAWGGGVAWPAARCPSTLRLQRATMRHWGPCGCSPAATMCALCADAVRRTGSSQRATGNHRRISVKRVLAQ